MINLIKYINFDINSFYQLNTPRAISIALPFLTLHSKTKNLATIGSTSLHLYTLWHTPEEKTTTGSKWGDAALFVATATVKSYFPVFSLILANSIQLERLLAAKNWSARGIAVIKIADQWIESLTLHFDAPAWKTRSLFSHMISDGMEAVLKHKPKKTPETVGALLFAACRGYQIATAELPAPPIEEEPDYPDPEPALTAALPEEDVDLSKFIDENQCTLKGADNREFDLGSHVHGYGKYLVKGANLQFRKINGDQEVELSFRLNHLYRRRLRRIVEGFKSLSPEKQKEFALVNQASGMNIESDASYVLGGKEFKDGTANLLTFEGIGSLMVAKGKYYNLRDRITVTLKAGATLSSFSHFLSVFGLRDVVEKSTADDIERIKLGVLFRTFFPAEAHLLERDDAFFMLPLAKLRKSMVKIAPQMKSYFQKYQVRKFEVFPGYFRYGVLIADHIRNLGGRGLTTALTSISDEKTLSSKALKQLENILKIGILSQEQREKTGLGANGLNGNYDYKIGGAQSVYTQMVTQHDVTNQTRMSGWGYSSPVRLFITLNVLDRGSYQYMTDSDGARNNNAYINRSPIQEFMHEDLSTHRSHEVMIPDRVLPEEIKAMSVKTQQIKDQIIAHFRLCHLIQKDAQGIERINDIAVDDFIRTEHCITADHVKNN